MDNKLKFYRGEIDKVDDKIFNLLEKRFRIVNDVGKYKKQHGLPIKVLSREEEIIKKRIRISRLSPEFIKRFYRLIINYSYKLEKICQKKLK